MIKKSFNERDFLRYLVENGHKNNIKDNIVDFGSVHFAIEKRNYKDFKRTTQAIQDRLDHNKVIPAQLILKWLELLKTKEEVIKDRETKEVSFAANDRSVKHAAMTEAAYSFFTKNTRLKNEYDFSEEYAITDPFNDRIMRSQNFKGLLNLCIKSYLTQPKRVMDSYNKDSALVYFYNLMHKEEMFFGNKLPHKLTDNKTRIIAAYLMITVAKKHNHYINSELNTKILCNLANSIFKKKINPS